LRCASIELLVVGCWNMLWRVASHILSVSDPETWAGGMVIRDSGSEHAVASRESSLGWKLLVHDAGTH
jgi:hypothetical protein